MRRVRFVWRVFAGVALVTFLAGLVLEIAVVAPLAERVRRASADPSRAPLSAAEVEARVHDARGVIRSGTALAAGFALVLAWLVARRVSQPLAEIAEQVGRIGRGGAPGRLLVHGGGELADLSAGVNAMIDELETRLDRLRRQQSEREAVLSAMTEGVVAVDREERVLFVNAAARDMLRAGADDLRGRPVRELTRVPEVGATIARSLSEGHRIRTEARLSGQGGERVLELGAAPWTDEDGSRRLGCVLVLHDISELRRLEAVRRDFVANVSHELKTPLTSMRGFLETVIEDPAMDADQRRGFLSRARENTERLAAIVSDLLSLARLESGAEVLRFEAIDLAAVATAVVEEARDQAGRRRIELELAGAGAPLVVTGDRQALFVAIDNLVDNALKYSPEGGRVAVRLGSAEKAWIEVADQGPGIPLHEQERIFERFYRVDRDRSRRLGGTGLGLSIVRHVALAHGGSVSVDSAPGRGSTFRIEVPRHDQLRIPP